MPLHFRCPKFESRLPKLLFIFIFDKILYIYLFLILSILECGREGHCKSMEHMTLSHMSVVPHCHWWCFCRKLVSRQACLFIIQPVTPLTAVLSAWHFLFTHKLYIPPSPMMYQRSSLFIQYASLNHLPLASFYLWSPPSCWAEITYSFRRVRSTDSSPFPVMHISLVSLITLSQPYEHRYLTLVSIEILFPFPKALCATYQDQPWRIYF